MQVARADEEKRLTLKKKEEEERRMREAEEKKQREIEEKRRRLEEAERKRQAMMQSMKVKKYWECMHCQERAATHSVSVIHLYICTIRMNDNYVNGLYSNLSFSPYLNFWTI